MDAQTAQTTGKREPDCLPDEEIDGYVAHIGSIGHFAGGDFYHPYVAPEELLPLASQALKLIDLDARNPNYEDFLEELRKIVPQLARCVLEWSRRFDQLVKTQKVSSTNETPLNDLAHLGSHLVSIMLFLNPDKLMDSALRSFYEREKSGLAGGLEKHLKLCKRGIEKALKVGDIWTRIVEK